jgi:shikimate dehydrogenase
VTDGDVPRPEPGRVNAAVLGSPIGHSLSPALHLAAYAGLGLDWTFGLVECPKSELAAMLRLLDADRLAGVALTMPLKQAVIPMLASIDPLAARTESVNTVLFRGPGDWWGTNTDVAGIVAALAEGGVTSAGSATVLGAGATAASAIAALSQLGAADIEVFARRPEAAAELLDVAERFGVEVVVRPWSEAGAVQDRAVVVATVPPRGADELAGRITSASGVLLDVVYRPWPTTLASAWTKAGGVAVSGLAMLVAQAGQQVRLMTGLEPDVAAMRAAGEATLQG